jgi:hypothetical protein
MAAIVVVSSDFCKRLAAQTPLLPADELHVGRVKDHERPGEGPLAQNSTTAALQ